jgi:dTDP-D-glucose 4,6-dehydratase
VNESPACTSLAHDSTRGSVLAQQTGTPEEDYTKLVTFVPDRPGHDRRYALDSRAVSRTLSWQPSQNLADGIARTVLAVLFAKRAARL